jgi:hypothetical protein
MAKAAQRGGNTGRAGNRNDHHDEKGPEKARTTKILVGTPWPDGIEVAVKPVPRDLRDGVAIGLGTLFGALLVAFVIYGMIVSHEYILKQAFSLVQYGLGAIGVWAVGWKTLKYVGMVGHDKGQNT